MRPAGARAISAIGGEINFNRYDMNFQGPRDFSPYIEQYQRIVTYLLYIRSNYPEIFETLLLAPQFEYEIEVCRFKRGRARSFLIMLRTLVRNYERSKHAVNGRQHVQEDQVAVLGWRRY